jgi:hypothetical protein
MMPHTFKSPDGAVGTALRYRRAFLAVNEVDRIVLTGSGGRLHPFIPLDPFHGVQRAYAFDGVGRPWYAQISAATRRHANGDYEWTWPAAQIHRYERLTTIAVSEDPITGQVQDPAWAYSPSAFHRLAYLSTAGGKEQYWIAASPHGHDRFWRYRLPLADLWKKLLPPGARPTKLAGSPHESTRDQGTVYEQLVAADLIRQSAGRFALYRPAMDIAGRDLLVQLVNSWRTISLQIKGTTKIIRGSVIQCMVKRPTFQPAEDFWLAFYFFDAEAGHFWKDYWLVPSLDFAALTADQHFPGSIGFHVTLNGDNNRWRKFRHSIDKQGDVLHRALISLGAGR